MPKNLTITFRETADGRQEIHLSSPDAMLTLPPYDDLQLTQLHQALEEYLINKYCPNIED